MLEKWKLFALISMFFAGLTSVIAKYGMKDLSSDVALVLRTLIVFLIVITNAFLFSNVFMELKMASKMNYVYLFISGITTALSWIFYYRAIKIGHVSFVAGIDKASILVTLLLSFLILKEPLTLKVITGAVLIFIGLLVLLWK